MSIWVSLKCCSTNSYHWPLADLLTHPIDVSSLGVCCTDKGSHAGATHHVYRYTYKKSIHEWDTSDVNSRFRIFGYCNCLWSQGIESRTYAERKLKQLRKGCTTFFRWFNPFILLHQYASSPYCSLYISLGVDKENCLTIKSLLKCLSFPLFS